MNKKFLIFYDSEMEPYILLGIVTYHREIDPTIVIEHPSVRCGGGWWQLTKDRTLRLYGDSDDFGKYDKEVAQEAFDKKNVLYYDDSFGFEDLGIKKLLMLE